LKYCYPLDLVNLSLFNHEVPLQQILQLLPRRGVANALVSYVEKSLSGE